MTTTAYNYNPTTLQLQLHLQLQLRYTTLHPAVVVRWPLQPLQPLQKTQLQPPSSPSVDMLCRLWVTTTNLSYRFPIFETSATALCGTTGTTHRPYLWFGAVRMWIAEGPTEGCATGVKRLDWPQFWPKIQLPQQQSHDGKNHVGPFSLGRLFGSSDFLGPWWWPWWWPCWPFV